MEVSGVSLHTNEFHWKRKRPVWQALRKISFRHLWFIFFAMKVDPKTNYLSKQFRSHRLFCFQFCLQLLVAFIISSVSLSHHQYSVVLMLRKLAIGCVQRSRLQVPLILQRDKPKSSWVPGLVSSNLAK